MQLLGCIFQAFQAFDRDYTGRIKCTDFRRVLDNFCFKLTNKQFKEVTIVLSVFSDGSVDYFAFLDNFTGSTITVSTIVRIAGSSNYVLM